MGSPGGRSRHDGIRVGLIGFGFAARTFHLPLLGATAGFRVVAVASSRAAEVTAALPHVAVVPEPAALATRPDLDLIVIATPNDTHTALAEAALGAGKHVVVDKPFTLTLAEARRLGRLALDRRRVLSVFHNRRWDSDFLTVQAAIRRGLLGEVVRLDSRLDRFRPEVRDRWRERPAPGAGLLYDLAPHLVDQALVLFGIPDTVEATLAIQRPGARAVDFFHLVLRYGKRVVTLEAGSLVAGGSARFTVHGDRASLIKRAPDRQEDQLKAGVIPGTSEWGADPDDAVLHDGATGASTAVPALPGDQRRYYAALREAMVRDAPNPVTPEQGATVMAILEAAGRSASEGRRLVPDVSAGERAAWPIVRSA
jgi:predicted dehydrogenase